MEIAVAMIISSMMISMILITLFDDRVVILRNQLL